MSGARTVAIDIGGTGIKAALLDETGHLIGGRHRVPTPPKPLQPDALLQAIDRVVTPVGEFDRVSVGFPGYIRDGRVMTAPNLGTEVLGGFDLQAALAQRWGKPVRVLNDADVQGFGAIKGQGIEMVLTLGTGAGTSLFRNGELMPHLELAHHPIRGRKTYDEWLGNATLAKKGKKAWNKRVEEVIGVLRTVVCFDHLYIGGGNAKAIKFQLPSDVSTVSNIDGLTGGIALWREPGGAAHPTAANDGAAASPE